MQIPPFSGYFLPLRPKYLPQHHTSKHLPSAHILFFNVTEHISNPYIVTGKITLVLPQHPQGYLENHNLTATSFQIKN
jgi:hypothetical protein